MRRRDVIPVPSALTPVAPAPSPIAWLALAPWVLALATAVAGCGLLGDKLAPASGGLPRGSDQPSPGETLAAGTLGPARTPIPGFEAWRLINPQAVRISVEDGALLMDLIGSVLWFNADRGVLLYREVTGDFRATATVLSSKASDPSSPPGQDGTVQLAGLMARTEVPAENSVFIVSGSIGMSTGLETKTTTSSHSIYVQRGLPTGGDAELKLCRVGPTFDLYWRPAASTEDWTHMSTFERRDMPQTLQVGANIYTDGVPDIVARFEGLEIVPLPAGRAC